MGKIRGQFGRATAVALLGVSESLFTGAFELNDHGFVLVKVASDDLARPLSANILYANPACSRLGIEVEPLDEQWTQDSTVTSTDESTSTTADQAWLVTQAEVVRKQQPRSVIRYVPSAQRWLRYYLFPVTTDVYGAFISESIGPAEGDLASHARFGDLVIDYAARTVHKDGRPVDLTPTEYALLALLSKSPNVVMPSQELLSALWDTHWIGDDSALDVHVSRLRRKIGESGARPRYIRTIRGLGLKFDPDPSPQQPGPEGDRSTIQPRDVDWPAAGADSRQSRGPRLSGHDRAPGREPHPGSSSSAAPLDGNRADFRPDSSP